MVVFKFPDGHVMALYDGCATESQNAAFAKAVSNEGNERRKHGKTTFGVVFVANSEWAESSMESRQAS